MNKFKEYRARKKVGLSAVDVIVMQEAGVFIPGGVSCRLKMPPMSDEERRKKKAEKMREYRGEKKSSGVVDATGSERARRYRQRKKFRKYCEENSIVCPPHVESIEGLLEWVAAR